MAHSTTVMTMPAQADAALRGQDAAEDGGGLAREHEAEHDGVLGEDEQADQRVGLPPVEREQRLQEPADHGVPSVRRRRRAETAGPSHARPSVDGAAACTRVG